MIGKTKIVWEGLNFFCYSGDVFPCISKGRNRTTTSLCIPFPGHNIHICITPHHTTPHHITICYTPSTRSRTPVICRSDCVSRSSLTHKVLGRHRVAVVAGATSLQGLFQEGTLGILAVTECHHGIYVASLVSLDSSQKLCFRREFVDSNICFFVAGEGFSVRRR